MPVPARIFISYAREDEQTAEALAEHLDQLKSLSIAETWSDRDIPLGASWEETIATEASEADVIILLVSHAYLASGFAHDKELSLIQRAHAHGARVVPVVVGECAWQAHPFIGSLQAFARGKRLERPTTMTFQRQAAELVEAVRSLVGDRTEADAQTVESEPQPARAHQGARVDDRTRIQRKPAPRRSSM